MRERDACATVLIWRTWCAHSQLLWRHSFCC